MIKDCHSFIFDIIKDETLSVTHEGVRRSRRNVVLAQRHDLPDRPRCRPEEAPETPPEGTLPSGKIAGALGRRTSFFRLGDYGRFGGVVLDAGRADPEVRKEL